MKIKEVISNWKFILLGLGILGFHILTMRTIFSLPNFEGNNLMIGVVLWGGMSIVSLWIAWKLGLFSSDKKWGFLGAVGFVGIGFIILFGVTLLGSQILMLEQGVGQTTVNQSALQNSGLPALLLFIFVVLLAPTIEELIFRGILMGKVFGKDSIVGLLLSSFLFGLSHTPTNIGSWVIYGGMGLVLGLIYRFSGKFSYAIALHFINNLLSFGIMLLLQQV